MEQKLKHLEMIQGITHRLSKNSFLTKVLTVVITSAFFALAVKGHRSDFVYVAFFPAFMFWALDGYLQWQERLFLSLHEKVRAQPAETEVDFTIDTRSVSQGGKGWSSATFSRTLAWFHGTVIGTILLVMALLE